MSSSKKQRKKTEYTAGSLTEFINVIEKICLERGRFLFRGQLEEDKEGLIPEFFRDKTEIKYKTIKTEKAMLDDFIRRGKPLFNIEPQSKCERLALAQHHGMPTRLLDWTSNALVALWFVAKHPNKDKKDGVVWVLSFDAKDRGDDSLDPFKISKPEILRPKHIEKRLIAQGGWFTIHPEKKPLDKYENFRGKLRSIRIPYADDRFEDIRFRLNLCGLNRVTLFPDLDGLCEHIAYQNSKVYLVRRDGTSKK